MGGAYGKQTEIEQGSRLSGVKYKDAFEGLSQTDIPSQSKITDIWFHMNYHLNFKRILHEERSVKLKQLEQHLNAIADVISPENGFALYFLGYIQYKNNGRIEPELIRRLQNQIDDSVYWRERLESFGLSIDHLIDNNFPSEGIPQ
jgi:hypothetical protein